MSAPDLTKKVVGFRTWNLGERDELQSTSVGKTWGRGVHEARCNGGFGASFMQTAMSIHGYGTGTGTGKAEETEPEKHDAPGAKCDCGLYAHHKLGDDWLAPPPFSGADQVRGAILAWGRMQVHESGFRAQYAEPLVLAFHPSWPRSLIERVNRIAEDYEITALPVGQIEDFAIAHGKAVPKELYPPPEKAESEAPSKVIQPQTPYLVPTPNLYWQPTMKPKWIQ